MTTGRWRTAALVLAALLVAAVVALVLALRSTDERASRALALARAEAAATRAAKAAAVHLTSYDRSSLATDFDWARTLGTASFQRKYAGVVPGVKQYVAELEVHAVGTVDDAAARAEDSAHVTVLLFVDQTLVSAKTGERKLVTPRITMTMVRSGGRWLVQDASLRNLADS